MHFSHLTPLLALGRFAFAAPYQNVTGLIQSNQWSPETQIFFPNDTSFENSTQRWNAYGAPTYIAAVRPATEEDVQRAVRLATSNGIPFLATGGRHGYGTSFGKLDNGLAIDLSAFKTIEVDKEANTMTIGGAVLFREIMDPLYEAGKEIQTGSCACVGMVGATLGAGVGRYQGLHGLIIDALISVRMVTAQGDLVTVSATSNPDLFWGLRGAGMNFGVITSATYQVADLTNDGQVMNADLIFPASANASYFAALESFQGKLPKELSLFSVINYNETTSETQIIANLVYAGPEDEGRELIAPFLELEPTVQSISTVPWNKLIATSGFALNDVFCNKGDTHSMYSVNVRNISGSTYEQLFAKLDSFYAENPAGRATTSEIEFFPSQAVQAVPDEDTAFPWRDANAYVMLGFSWTDDSVEEAANALANELRADVVATSGYDDLTVYVSYAHSDETLEQMFGASKLPRLASLKKQWDPNNVFGYGNALPTSYGGGY